MNDKVHLLLIDDEKNYLLVLETLLTEAGYAVTALNDPETALAFLEESEVDIVIIVIIGVTIWLLVHMVGDNQQENTCQNRGDNQFVVACAAQNQRCADEQNTKGKTDEGLGIFHRWPRFR